jgi:hypothetical protein
LLQAGSLSTDWRPQKDTHEVIPDAFLAFRGAWWSILKQKCYRRWDLGLPLHPREQGWIDDLETSSLFSQKEIEDSAVYRESDGYCFLGFSLSFFIDFTPPGSTINAAAYQKI